MPILNNFNMDRKDFFSAKELQKLLDEDPKLNKELERRQAKFEKMTFVFPLTYSIEDKNANR